MKATVRLLGCCALLSLLVGAAPQPLVPEAPSPRAGACSFTINMGTILQDEVYGTVSATCPYAIDQILVELISLPPGASQVVLEERTIEYNQGNANVVGENYSGSNYYRTQAKVWYTDDNYDVWTDTDFVEAYF